MKEEKPKEKAKKQKAKEEAKEEAKPKPRYLYWLAVIVVIAAIAAALIYASGSLSGVSFSSFKQNFLSSKSAALVVYSYNESIYSLEASCQNAMLELINSQTVHPTMNLYVIVNSSLCYYENNLGTVISGNTVPTSTEAGCLTNSSGYPSITLSYGQSNSTTITPYHMTIEGNEAYMRGCPIAVDIS